MQRADRFLLAVLALSLAANVVTIYLWHHKGTTAGASFEAQTGSQMLPQRGTRLNSLQLVNDAGEPHRLQFGPGQLPTVVYVLSPSCKWCAANQTNINGLASRLENRYRVIGLSIVPHAQWNAEAESSYHFPIFFLQPDSPHPGFALNLTPETLVFSRDGALDQGWAGAYMDETGHQIATYFGVRSSDWILSQGMTHP